MNINISPTKVSRRKAIRLAVCGFAAPALAFFGSRLRLIAATTVPEPQQAGGALGYPSASVLEPNQLAALLSRPGDKPAVICVGFKFLYDSAHVPGSIFLGPAREAGGLLALQKWAESVPRNKAVVVYCGCCPWDKCPNMRPAYDMLTKMGFSQLKVLHIDQDFARDWVQKGLPTEKK